MEYENYHIPGAIVIDYKKANFADEFKKLDKNIPVLIYCRSGVRSANAIPILEDLGFEVYNLGHGMLDWRKNHMPIQGKNVNAKDAGEEGC
jgi:rhodanese-related sulfurtransferase